MLVPYPMRVICQMSSNGLFRIVVLPNPQVLEHEVWATMGITINNRLAHEVPDAIVKHPEVYLASVGVGRFNLVIAAGFHHIDFINQFLNIKLPAIKGISYVETFLHNKPMNSPCSKLQGITSAPLCFADKADYNFALNPSHAASSGEFKFKISQYSLAYLKKRDVSLLQ